MDSIVWIVIGIGLIFSALAGALKIGLWVWFMTSILGRPMQQYQDAPVAKRGSAANGFKSTLTIIATVLGIISTTVGLVEKCGGGGSTVVQTQTAPTIGYRCCTSIGACPMMMGGQPVGATCTCVGMAGTIQGSVCQ